MKLLILALVLGCLAACTLAESELKCGPLQKIKVKRQWDKAFGEGSDRLEFAIHLWKTFFKTFPKVRDVFTKYRGDNIYSPEFQASSQRILGGFAMLIETADDPEALKVLLGNVKADHSEKGIQPAVYEALRDGLLEALPKYLKNHFDWDAWMGCLTALIDNLK